MKNTNTDTPRVDAEVSNDPVINHRVSGFRFHRMAGLARTLERELAVAESKLGAAVIEAQQKDREIERLQAVVNEYESQWVDEHV